MLIDLVLLVLAVVGVAAIALLGAFALLGAGGAVAFGRFSERIFDRVVSKQANDLGHEGLVGKVATVLRVTDEGAGRVVYSVRVGGESWTARCDELLAAGSRAEVTGVDGLVLTIRAAPGSPAE